MTSRTHLANEAWEAMLAAHGSLMRQFAAQDVWGDLTMREYDALYTLSKCAEPISLGELNRHVLLSQPAMSRMVDRLVARGLIRRERAAEDGRSVRLSLSPAGAEAQRRVGRAHGRDVGRMLGAALDREELEALARICGRLLAPGVENGAEVLS